MHVYSAKDPVFFNKGSHKWGGGGIIRDQGNAFSRTYFFVIWEIMHVINSTIMAYNQSDNSIEINIACF